MSKQQSDYTTPEQSKRLLELGVPAGSADCYYKESGKIEIKNTALDTLYPSCWSVGRLIEILKECINNEDELIDIFVELQYSNNLLTTVLMIFRDNKAILDFSKLEE